jgi:hypothetical protein
MQEIERAIKEQKVRPKKIGCSAARFGNHWEYLGGGRALPFSCQIGKRVLEIDGDTEFLDEMGRVIVGGLDNQDVFLKARNIREKNPTWEWSSD